MLIVNLGKYGITKGAYFLAPGVNVDVTDEVAKELLNTYKKGVHKIYFQKALDAIQQQEFIEPIEKKKRGRKKKATNGDNTL